MSVQDSQHTHLNNLSHALLRLHKALSDAERLSYERVHGRIASNGAFRQLVLEDSWLTWLRPLSHSITRLDEVAEKGQTASGAESTALLASVRILLTLAETGEGFDRYYDDALQRVPEVGLAHAQVRALLGSRQP